jgi:hypothetical protein
MLAVGFEPTKRFASDLKSDPFDQTRVHKQVICDYDDKILSLTGLLGESPPAHCETRTHGHEIKSLALYRLS